jgi:predicted CoA-binding protein
VFDCQNELILHLGLIFEHYYIMADKKTLVLGATPNAGRYAYLAANRLVGHGHSIVNVGLKSGTVAGIAIEKPQEIHHDIDTITLYVGPQNQPPLYDYILNTKPKRIIFNPGTENTELQKMANDKGIATEYACTLVLLSIGEY